MTINIAVFPGGDTSSSLQSHQEGFGLLPKDWIFASHDLDEVKELDQSIRLVGRRFFGVTVLRQICCWIFLCLLALGADASAKTETTLPDLETIISRMAQSSVENRANFRSYVVTRDYNFFGKERDKSKSRVTVDVTFVPPDSKEYTIQQTIGNSIGERVVRRILESEKEIVKNHETADISRDNYDFRLVREEVFKGRRCHVLELLPKRKDKNLLHAQIWVDAETYLFHRLEGEPAKSPSWWVRDIHITFLFGEVGGMWLQTVSESTVTVRIIGRYTMVASDQKYKFSKVLAVDYPLQPDMQPNDERFSSARSSSTRIGVKDSWAAWIKPLPGAPSKSFGAVE
jgi:hypothetical protein